MIGVGFILADVTKYFILPTIVVPPVQEAAAPRVEVLADFLVSISINQDAPSISIPSSQEQEHSPIISQGFEESPKKHHLFHDDYILRNLTNEDSTISRNIIDCRLFFTPILKHLASRPDLNYDVCLCARYQAKPTEKHLQAVKRIFRYLKRNIAQKSTAITSSTEIPLVMRHKRVLIALLLHNVSNIQEQSTSIFANIFIKGESGEWDS
ncbi:hypothetical protein Tco_1343705 [Tanacetum coccineum]